MQKKIIVIGALIIVGGVFTAWYYRASMHGGAYPEPDAAVAGTASTDGSQCHDSAKYLFVQHGIADSVNSDILVKYKKDPAEVIPCAYALGDGDFEIKNADAEYFLAFTDDFLVLDQGTAPDPRGLVAYDLRSRTVVFTDTYAKPFSAQGNVITYLAKTSQKPTAQNCPSLDEYVKNGLGAAIMSKVTVDLATREKTDIGPAQCIATQ